MRLIQRQSRFCVSRNNREGSEASIVALVRSCDSRGDVRQDGSTVEAIYLNDSFVRSLGPKAQPIRNITGRAHRHSPGAFDSFVPSGLMLPIPPYPARRHCLLADYICRRRVDPYWQRGVCRRAAERREHVRLLMKKRSKLVKSNGRAQKNAFFYLHFLASFRRSRDFIRHQPIMALRMTESMIA